MGAPTEIVVAVFLVSLVATLVLLPVAIRMGPALGLLTLPGGRHVHVAPIPKSGGLAIVVGVLLPLLLWVSHSIGFLSTIMTMVVVAVLGYVDDRYDVRARYELLAQMLCSLTVVTVWLVGDAVEFASVPLACIAVLFVVGVTNAINMSDGLDGLAAGSTLLIYLFLALLAYQIGSLQLTVLAVALTGGLVAFLAFNNHPARVFMGDAGSQFLGFGAAALAVAMVSEPQFAASPAIFVLVFGVPILDTALVVALRLRASQSIFAADKNHIHHHLLALGLSQPQVVAVMYALKAVAIALAYAMRFEHEVLILLVYGLLSAVVLGALFVAHRSAAVRQKAVGVERRSAFFRNLEFVHSYAHACIAAALGVALLASAWFMDGPYYVSGWYVLALAGVMLLGWLLLARGSNLWIARLVFLVCTLSMAWAFWEAADGRPVFNAGVDLMFAGLAVFLAVAIRVTRKDVFALDAQDYLVFLLAALLAIIAWSDSSMLHTVRVALRLLLLLFAAEFVFVRGRKAANILILSSILSIVLLGWGELAV